MSGPILSVRNLSVRFDGAAAAEAVSFELSTGRTLALVGESGCGKTVTAQAVLRLVDGAEVSGEVLYRGEDLLRADERRLQALRGKRIGFMFQSASASLDPLQRIGDAVTEARHGRAKMSRSERRALAVELLKAVQLPDAEARVDDHPHQLSGGMQQRVALAAALADDPEILIADEPTTALDTTVQAQIVALLRQLQDTRATALLVISHDLPLVASLADRVVVMYAGQIVEQGPTAAVLETPRHPYSEGLIAAARRTKRGDTLAVIEGRVPGLKDRPVGCRFAPRCAHATTTCTDAAPALGPVDDDIPLMPGAPAPVGDHLVRCYFPRPG